MMAAALMLVLAATADAPRPSPPAAAPAIDVDEKLGDRVPRDLTFTDARGRAVRLGEMFDGRHPVILVLAYFRCPMLCDLVLSGLSRPLHALRWTPGDEVRMLTVSIDPKDTPLAARHKQLAVLQAINHPEAESGWPFLVGDDASIHALAAAVGFRYAHDPASDQFAHPAVAIVLSPDGRITRYLYGVEFRLLDVRLAVTEAARGVVSAATLVGRALLTCFRYEPSARRYGFYVSAVLKGGAAVVLAAVAGLLGNLWRRDLRRMAAERRRREGQDADPT